MSTLKAVAAPQAEVAASPLTAELYFDSCGRNKWEVGSISGDRFGEIPSSLLTLWQALTNHPMRAVAGIHHQPHVGCGRLLTLLERARHTTDSPGAYTSHV